MTAPPDLTATLETALSIAREAGRLLRHGFTRAKQVSRKSSAVDLVTDYDTRTEKLIADRLHEALPDHHLLAEEGGATQRHGNGRLTWLIDPLDGTNNFAHGFPIFSISIALYEDQRPLLGLVYDPLRDECFTATASGGAHVRPLESNDPPEPIRVSDTDQLIDALLATGFPYDKQHSALNNLAQFSHMILRAQGIRRCGSAALDLCYVAAGRLDGFWEYKLHAWDVAAGRLIVNEAGGTTTTPDSAPLHLSTDRLHILATNGRIHTAAQDALHESTLIGEDR